ncbi:hypothetical protein [Natrinema gelatinilyticum]|uniref:hypothetical protein n=1 Tax=Natrinema gelatinilyticum TaxID=2961571 RepID=UPI0020C40E3A|nr:hypothetical protein [Natrinema gelatinilyticum]
MHVGRSGETDAQLAMGAGDAPLVGEYAAVRKQRLERVGAVMRELGVPEPAVR